MPDFTVIEGGGQGGGGSDSTEDYHAGDARYHFRNLIVEILRALPRGDDQRCRVGQELVAFMEHLSKTTAPLGAIIDPVISDIHKNICRDENSIEHYRLLYSVVRSALQVAAEASCHDNAAHGRCSQREQKLENSIEWFARK